MKKYKFKTAFTAFAAIITLTIVTLSIANAQSFKRQSNKEKSVRVDVLPVQLEKDKPVSFDIRMTTHSVTLNNDLVKGSVLKDDTGVTYSALNWNGTPPGGHHRSGTLEFPSLKGSPKSVTLIIKGVSNVPERIYEWTLQ